LKDKLAQLGFERDLQRLDRLLSEMEHLPAMLPLLLQTQREKTRLIACYLGAMAHSSQVIERAEMNEMIGAMLTVLNPFVPHQEKERVGAELSRIGRGEYLTSTAIAPQLEHK
jgi:hypothetical protein